MSLTSYDAWKLASPELIDVDSVPREFNVGDLVLADDDTHGTIREIDVDQFNGKTIVLYRVEYAIDAFETDCDWYGESQLARI